MTREEAIIILGNIPINGDECYSIAEYQEAKTMAIEALNFDIDQYCKEHFVVMVDEDLWDKAERALKQEPCEDAVSRLSVIDLVADYDLSMGQVVKGIHNLPCVKPQEPKTGQWEICQDDDGMYGICNICGQDSDFTYYGEVYKYCPNCGAKMESEEE